jgi:hypothetical protein
MVSSRDQIVVGRGSDSHNITHHYGTISGFRFTLDSPSFIVQLVNSRTLRTRESTMRGKKMHRCMGNHGGHSDLVAWDVTEFLYQHLGVVVVVD